MLTALQNETLVEIARMLDELNKELAPEDKHQLAGKQDLEQIIEQKSKLFSVFAKLKPIFALANGKTDMMAALPEIMPAITALQKDEQLSTDLAQIIALLP